MGLTVFLYTDAPSFYLASCCWRSRSCARHHPVGWGPLVLIAHIASLRRQLLPCPLRSSSALVLFGDQLLGVAMEAVTRDSVRRGAWASVSDGASRPFRSSHDEPGAGTAVPGQARRRRRRWPRRARLTGRTSSDPGPGRRGDSGRWRRPAPVLGQERRDVEELVVQPHAHLGRATAAVTTRTWPASRPSRPRRTPSRWPSSGWPRPWPEQRRSRDAGQARRRRPAAASGRWPPRPLLTTSGAADGAEARLDRRRSRALRWQPARSTRRWPPRPRLGPAGDTASCWARRATTSTYDTSSTAACSAT